MQSQTILNKIQFHGIKTVYPIGEQVVAYFTVPEFRQPECGDWIGIFPVGWTSLVRDCIARQVVRIEQLNGQYGKVEFESMIMPQVLNQHFQFVYVTNNGEYMVLGTSTPFRFVAQQMMQRERQQQQFVRDMESMVNMTNEWMPRQVVEQQQPQQQAETLMSGLLVESEIQKLQNEMVNLEQGLLWQQEQRQQQQQQQQQLVRECDLLNTQRPLSRNFLVEPMQQQTVVVEPIVVQQQQQQTPLLLNKVEQMMKETVRVEQAQRRLEQFNLLAQLKSCERHIVSVQKREAEIKEFLLRARLQNKMAAFEHKVNQVVRMNQRGIDLQTPVEHYMRKYEQLLREKVQLEVEKRRAILIKLRQTVRDCERRLRELQVIDQDHMTTFHSMLRNKINRIENIVAATVAVEALPRHLETIMVPFMQEQEQQTLNLHQAQRQLVNLVNEITVRLQELETDIGCYSLLRIPKIATQMMLFTNPKLAQIVQLEKKIAEQKLKLKLKMWLVSQGLNNGELTTMQTRLVEQLVRGVWFTPIVEQLRQIVAQLNRQQVRVAVASKLWIEKKITMINELINNLVQCQTELCTPANINWWFTPARIQTIIVQLQQLQETECVEIPRLLQQECQITGVAQLVREICQSLRQVLTEKIVEMTQIVQLIRQQVPTGLFTQQQQQQWTVPSWMWMTVVQQQQQPRLIQQQQTMLELIEIEKKLVEMKGMALLSIHNMHLNERLVELENFLRAFAVAEVVKRERCMEKIRQMRVILNEQPLEIQQISLVTMPERFWQQQQQRFERLWQQIVELECHIIEQIAMPAQWFNRFEGSFMPSILRTPFNLINVNWIQQKFLRLVQEFQLEFPECYSPKIQEIVTFLRQTIVNQQQQQFVANKQTLVQLLKEKLVEFETILNQPECEIACLTTVIFPQSTQGTFRGQRECWKNLIRQVRELKSHMQQQQQQLLQQQQPQQWINQVVIPNTNTTMVSGMDIIMPQQQQQQILNIEQQQQQLQQQQNLSELFARKMALDTVCNRMPLQTTTVQPQQQQQQQQQPTIVKSISMPFAGLVRPTVNTIERMIEREELEWTNKQQQQQMRLPLEQQWVDECIDEEIEAVAADEEDEDIECQLTMSLNKPSIVRLETLGRNIEQQQQQLQQQIEKQIRKCISPKTVELEQADMCSLLCNRVENNIAEVMRQF